MSQEQPKKCGNCKHFGGKYFWDFHWCHKTGERKAEFRKHAGGMDPIDAFRHCPDPGVESHYGADRCSFHELVDVAVEQNT